MLDVVKHNLNSRVWHAVRRVDSKRGHRSRQGIPAVAAIRSLSRPGPEQIVVDPYLGQTMSRWCIVGSILHSNMVGTWARDGIVAGFIRLVGRMNLFVGAPLLDFDMGS